MKQRFKENASQLTILYVEDEPEIRYYFGGILERFFKRTVLAIDGADALECFREETIDLVLTDIKMPRMDGLRLIKSIRQIARKQPIAVVSAQDDDSTLLLELLNEKVLGFIKKPVFFEAVYEILGEICQEIVERQKLLDYVKELEAATGQSS
jgi:CheY-like chemotaxis protein